MMTLSMMVSQPVWILVTLIGVADILILMWCIALIRKNRRQQYSASMQDQFAISPELPASNVQFRQSLTCLQIDAVFDGLVALIETERIKLKSMIHPMASPLWTESAPLTDASEDNHEPAQDSNRRAAPERPLEQQINRFAVLGKNPAAIASQLGISLAEVNLAMRLQAGERSMAGHKLEAVA
jgi:hypothetical protein